MADQSSHPPGSTLLRAGRLARQSDVSVETLRYYERLGILTPDARSSGGQRLYSGRAVEAMKTIKVLQRLGFTLTTIAKLFTAVSTAADQPPCHVDETIRHELLIDVNDRLADLEAIRRCLASGQSLPSTLPSDERP